MSLCSDSIMLAQKERINAETWWIVRLWYNDAQLQGEVNVIDSLDKIPSLYHFTDRRNLDLIKQHGGLYSVSELAKLKITVPAPGGNDWSRDADALKGMGQYVHLCFRNSHPMDYVARADGRLADTVFLTIHADVLKWPNVLFTPDVSNKAGVDAVPIAQAKIDYEVLYKRTDWSNAALHERLKQAEKCEVLIPRMIPLSHIGFP